MPSPIEVSNTTEPIPTAMPRAVRKLRILWLDKAPIASLAVSLSNMIIIFSK
jgi:hypothetical protein